jgi:3-deoxy-D-manno-octulosonate 8-phosphate phosphatase (KDO 8-P phosphatase)
MKKRLPTALAKIELVILDVDGVMTDGRLHFGPHGEAQKTFHVRDGHGIKLLAARGVHVAILSGRNFSGVRVRAKELEVTDLVQGCKDKVTAAAKIAQKYDVSLQHCACLVDDTPDMPLMAAVGFAAAVADAHPLVQRAAHWVSRATGGHGAVRELCDRILRARGLRTARAAH